MSRQSTPPLLPDSTFDMSIYKFTAFALVAGLLATLTRMVLTLRFGSADALRFDGTLVGVVVQCLFAFILWRRPKSLRLIVKLIYLYLAVGISVKMTYLLFSNHGALYAELLWMVPWMSVSFVLSFLIFSRRTATILSTVVFGIWVIISAIFVMVYSGTTEGRQGLQLLSQTYFAQSVLIVFLALYAKLRGLYLVSRKSADRMELMANTDFLLGIPNRRAIQVELNEEMARAAKTGEPLSLILMDIDEFKQVNDEYGHNIGDAVLTDISSAVLSIVTSPNLFGRWGGDEFFILAPGIRRAESSRLAEKIRQSLEARHFDVGQVTASFGVTEYRIGETMDSVLQRVDAALYEGKKSGRNRVEEAI